MDNIFYFDTKKHNLQFTLMVDGIDRTHVIHALLKRGSAAGFFAEELTADLLRGSVNHVPAKGYDFISTGRAKPVECKGFNRNGVDLSPSDMKGVGRKFDQARFDADARTKDFVVGDTSALDSSFSYVVLPGEYVADVVGHKVKAKDADRLFKSGEIKKLADW